MHGIAEDASTWERFSVQLADAHAAHRDLAVLHLPAYERFHDLRASAGEPTAAEVLPDDARLAAELENSAVRLSRLRASGYEALMASLSARVRRMAGQRSTEEGMVSSLKDVLDAVDAFRVAELDGVDGRLFSLVMEGHGSRRSDRGRMLHVLLGEWASRSGVSVTRAVDCAQAFDLLANRAGDASAAADAFLARMDDLAYDPVEDLGPATAWEGLDPVAAGLALEGCQNRVMIGKP